MIQHTKDFIQRIASAASQDMQCFGILASVTMAQAILESGWGASELRRTKRALWNQGRQTLERQNIQYPDKGMV